MHAFCWSVQTLQLDWACAASNVAHAPTITRNAITSLFIVGSPASLEILLTARARGLVERGTQPLGELERIVIGPEMQEEESRLLVQHVAVDRSDLDAIGPQRHDYRIHLLSQEHEIAGNGRLTTTRRLEVDSSRDAKRTARAQLHAALDDSVAPRHPELIDTSASVAFQADDLVELRSVEIDGGRWAR